MGASWIILIELLFLSYDSDARFCPTLKESSYEKNSNYGFQALYFAVLPLAAVSQNLKESEDVPVDSASNACSDPIVLESNQKTCNICKIGSIR